MQRFVTNIVDELPEIGNNYMIYKVVADDVTKEYVYQNKTWVELPGGGSGLPDPTELADGAVLVKVGDEWKAQDGYGYEDGTIRFDENSTDYGFPIWKADAQFVRISSKILTKEEMTDGKAVRMKFVRNSSGIEVLETTEYVIPESDIYEDENGAISCKTGSYNDYVSYVGIISGEKGTVKYGEDSYSTIDLPEDGTYIHYYVKMTEPSYNDVISYIEPVGSVVKIDQKFIPEPAKIPTVGVISVYYDGAGAENTTISVTKAEFESMMSMRTSSNHRLAPIMYYKNGNTDMRGYLTCQNENEAPEDGYPTVFSGIVCDYDGEVYCVETVSVYWDENDNPVITADTYAYGFTDRLLPEASSSDEGKVLKIVDGTPTWVTE